MVQSWPTLYTESLYCLLAKVVWVRHPRKHQSPRTRSGALSYKKKRIMQNAEEHEGGEEEEEEEEEDEQEEKEDGEGFAGKGENEEEKGER